MKRTIAGFKEAVQATIRNERGSYMPPLRNTQLTHQEAAMLPIAAAFGEKDRGPSAASRYDMLVKSDISVVVNSLTF